MSQTIVEIREGVLWVWQFVMGKPELWRKFQIDGMDRDHRAHITLEGGAPTLPPTTCDSVRFEFRNPMYGACVINYTDGRSDFLLGKTIDDAVFPFAAP